MTNKAPNAERAGEITRITYKGIKHMNKQELSGYLRRVYLAGYKAGKEDTERAVKTQENQNGREH